MLGNTPVSDAELAELRRQCGLTEADFAAVNRHLVLSAIARLEAAEREKQFYAEATDERRALVRQLDVLLNGVEGAAKQAALCDIVAHFPRWLAARDAQQLRAGAAKALDEFAGQMDTTWTWKQINTKLKKEAKRMREIEHD